MTKSELLKDAVLWLGHMTTRLNEAPEPSGQEHDRVAPEVVAEVEAGFADVVSRFKAVEAVKYVPAAPVVAPVEATVEEVEPELEEEAPKSKKKKGRF